MLKLTKTGIGLLTKQYKSVLRKCLLLNLGLLFLLPNKVEAVDIGSYAYSDASDSFYGWDASSDFAILSAVTVNPLSMANWVSMGQHYSPIKYQTISSSKTIIQNLEAIDRVIGSFPLYVGITNLDNYDFTYRERLNNRLIHSIDYGSTIIDNLFALDYVLGALPSGTYVSNMQSMGDNVKALDTAIGAKIASDGHYIKKSDTNSITANLSALDYALYNYYYTFRVDERDEVIEFAKELRSNKKEMSSLDFMPIKSSSDFRINLIKAEAPLTFSAKTRDDSLVLMEVCHA